MTFFALGVVSVFPWVRFPLSLTLLVVCTFEATESVISSLSTSGLCSSRNGEETIKTLVGVWFYLNILLL